MDLKILNEKENSFFNRKEIEVEIKHPNSATPAKAAVLKEIATKYSAPEENVIIDYIFTRKGSCESLVKVKVYEKKPKIKIKKAEGKEGKIDELEKKEGKKDETQTSEAK